MSYENAPATQMIASHCCVCNRPLVDSVSVELGIGPDCRKKHGYNVEATEENRKAANVLVHKVAAAWNTSTKMDLMAALKELQGLGFAQLAATIARRLAAVTITENEGVYTVDASYSEAATEAFRRVPGRRWNAEKKVNEFPSTSKGHLLAALRSVYSGQVAVGPKGVFTI